ncbi:unnamed protein product [Caenorhabditis angaria]|uniref:Uncharacterized protein n=1 Tax=Caenorhabditis angaria TaxID=860376 RepID=A0A9P1IXM6_9PELO|nr:unnamed protein product [Caenorhabditis angaria]
MIKRIPYLSMFILLLILFDAAFARQKFMVRKGGRLDRLHKKTTHDWAHAAHKYRSGKRHKRRRHYRDGTFRVDNILAQMDSFVRPRFGRSVKWSEVSLSPTR